jgi:predicted DNA-binding helix-hairpin-helix protein
MRRWRRIRLEDLVALKVNLKKAMPFVVCANHHPGLAELASDRLLARFTPPPQQMALELA